MSEVGHKISYLYDFGDDWLHRLRLEAIEPAEPDDGLGSVLTGKGACPPEDCGGIWGFQDLLHAAQQPRDQLDDEQIERLDWFDIDDLHFDLEQVNTRVRRIGDLRS